MRCLGDIDVLIGGDAVAREEVRSAERLKQEAQALVAETQPASPSSS